MTIAYLIVLYDFYHTHTHTHTHSVSLLLASGENKSLDFTIVGSMNTPSQKQKQMVASNVIRENMPNIVSVCVY